MTELYSFLDGAFADMRARLDQEYQRRMTAHATALTSEVSAVHYTPNYGKIDVEEAFRLFHKQMCGCRHSYEQKTAPTTLSISGYEKRIGPSGESGYYIKQFPSLEAHLTSILPPGAWIIHAVHESQTTRNQNSSGNWSENHSYFITVYDNYGLQYKYGMASDGTSSRTCHQFFVFQHGDPPPQINGPPKSKPYALSNNLIDFCKSFKADPYEPKQQPSIYPYKQYVPGEKEKPLQTLAERDYKQAALLKLYKSPTGCPDYLTLKCEKERIEQLLAATQKQLADAQTQIAELEKQRKKAEPVFPELLISELTPSHSPPSPLDPAVLAELESILTYS